MIFKNQLDIMQEGELCGKHDRYKKIPRNHNGCVGFLFLQVYFVKALLNSFKQIPY